MKFYEAKWKKLKESPIFIVSINMSSGQNDDNDKMMSHSYQHILSLWLPPVDGWENFTSNALFCVWDVQVM